MNGHLSVGATMICYDGSPLYPDASTKLRILQHHKCTYFGTSPRYLLELEMSGIKPSQFDLKNLRMVTTTGATLTTDQFGWFYKAFPSSVHLSSVAGGTEICTSWMASDPAGPVYAGEMQMPALGQDVDVGDPETGESIKHVRHCEHFCQSYEHGVWSEQQDRTKTLLFRNASIAGSQVCLADREHDLFSLPAPLFEKRKRINYIALARRSWGTHMQNPLSIYANLLLWR